MHGLQLSFQWPGWRAGSGVKFCPEFPIWQFPKVTLNIDPISSTVEQQTDLPKAKAGWARRCLDIYVIRASTPG